VRPKCRGSGRAGRTSAVPAADNGDGATTGGAPARDGPAVTRRGSDMSTRWGRRCATTAYCRRKGGGRQWRCPADAARPCLGTQRADGEQEAASPRPSAQGGGSARRGERRLGARGSCYAQRRVVSPRLLQRRQCHFNGGMENGEEDRMEQWCSGVQHLNAAEATRKRMTGGSHKISNLIDFLQRPTSNFEKLLFPASKIYVKL
jgi:hypothetical protein